MARQAWGYGADIDYMKIFRIMKAGDWLIIASALVLSVALAVRVWLPGRADEARVAKVYRDSQLVAELPMDEDGEYELSYDGYENVISVHAGRVSMARANCPDGYCVRQGAISHGGESIICLPHRLVIELDTGEESGLDAITS